MKAHTPIPYDPDNAWPKVEVANVRDCLKHLYKLGHLGPQMGPRRAYHGACKHGNAHGDLWKHIFSSLDCRFAERRTPAKKRLSIESDLLKTFAEEADPHLPPEARWHIALGRAKWGTYRHTGTVFVGRHYGLPTRCVDWTSDCLTALFIACRRHFNEPGVVWWMDYDEFSNCLARQWPKAYKKKEDITDDFQQDFKEGREKGVLIRLHHLTWMERPTRQDAWITLADQFAVRHDKAIHRLGVRDCGRLIVNASLKRELLSTLNGLGVNGQSLGLGDACVETIAADVAGEVLS